MLWMSGLRPAARLLTIPESWLRTLVEAFLPRRDLLALVAAADPGGPRGPSAAGLLRAEAETLALDEALAWEDAVYGVPPDGDDAMVWGLGLTREQERAREEAEIDAEEARRDRRRLQEW